jgi:hypothetical protein
MPTEEMWKQYLETLTDIRNYLEKSDDLQKQVAIQERAQVDKRPKAQEEESPMVGGPAASNAPGKGIAKEYDEIPKTTNRKEEEIIEHGDTMLKAKDEDPDDENSESESESSNDNEEIKSLLKSISEALSTQADVAGIIKSELKKAIPDALKSELPKYMEKMLHKEGYHPTHPDIVKLTDLSGLDTVSEVKKSADEKDEIKGDINKSAQEQDLVKAVDSLVSTDWRKLGQMREKAGLFNPWRQ